MSERPIDINLTQGTEVRVDDVIAQPTDEQRKQYRAKIAQVLDRTLTVDRLEVNLPSHLKGYWCPNDPISIAQAQMRGFEVDREFAVRNSLNDVSDGTARIADVVYMVRPTWMHEEEQKVKLANYKRTHLMDRRKQKEEIDFLAQNELPANVNSIANEVSGVQIEETLKKE